MPQFYDWPMKDSLKLPCTPLNISANIKHYTLQGGAEFNWEPLRFKHHPPPPFRGLVSAQRCWRGRKASRGGKGEEEGEPASLPAFVSIMCHGRSWLSCSVWLSLLLQQSLFPRWKSVSLRGRRRSLLCSASISAQLSSAQLSVAGLCSHLADTSSSADTLFPAWAQLADRQLSVWIKQERTHTL